MLTSLAALLDLVLPSECAACAAPGAALCRPCTGTLTDRPLTRDVDGLEVVAAGPYDGAARACLVAHKERGRLPLARPLGGALAAAVTALGLPGPLLLVPVPSSARAVRERGQDHARRLARAASRSLVTCGLPAQVAPVLVQVRRVRDQGGLDSAGRARNLAGALACRGDPARLRLPVVVVDDVVTTGATLREAARALRAAGAEVAGAAAVASTQRRHGAPDTLPGLCRPTGPV